MCKCTATIRVAHGGMQTVNEMGQKQGWRGRAISGFLAPWKVHPYSKEWGATKGHLHVSACFRIIQT